LVVIIEGGDVDDADGSSVDGNSRSYSAIMIEHQPNSELSFGYNSSITIPPYITLTNYCKFDVFACGSFPTPVLNPYGT